MQASILQLGRGPSHSITCTKQSTLWARSFRQVEKSSWLLAGLHVFQSGVWANVDISEDFCRTPVAGSPNPRGSLEHRLRTTGNFNTGDRSTTAAAYMYELCCKD